MSAGSDEPGSPTAPWGVAPPSPITESKIFNAARRTVTLLVEGGLDLRFWRMHVARACLVRAEGGWPNVLGKLDAAAQHTDAILLGVLDADFRRLEGKLPSRPDVVWTDAHDLEGTLFATPALDKLLDQLTTGWGQSPRNQTYRHAAEMGRLRWLVHQNADLELVFKKNPKGDLKLFEKYDNCVDDDWSPSLSSIIRAIIDYTPAQHLNAAEIEERCLALADADPHQLCNGHDLIGFLRVWPPIKKAKLKPDDLADRLAGACERRWLTTTSMWRDIEAWERLHPGFQVLRSDAEHDQVR